MDFDKVISKLSEKLKPSRLEHSIGVMNTAAELAKRFGADEKKARIAGILHDCAKWMDENEGYRFCESHNIELDEVSKNNYAIVHQYIGAVLAKDEFGIDDKEILDAIRCHATGKENMSTLEKIIHVADMTESSRNKKPYDGLSELRELCKTNLDKAVIFGLELSMMHVISKGKLVHPDTVLARNALILNTEAKNKRKK